jgi:hypothetical protein
MCSNGVRYKSGWLEPAQVCGGWLHCARQRTSAGFAPCLNGRLVWGVQYTILLFPARQRQVQWPQKSWVWLHGGDVLPP